MPDRAERFSSDQLTVNCRPARESDTSDMLELTDKIWEGQDYVPEVWSEWLSDPHGLLAVAEHAGRVLGLGKLTRLSDNDWWLEGLRVHPDFERRGIASQLHDYLLAYWQKTTGKRIGLATGSGRHAVHRLCERSGFHFVGELRQYNAKVINQEPMNLERLSGMDTPEVFRFVEQNPTLNPGFGMINLGWQWSIPSQEQIEATVDRSDAYGWLAPDHTLQSLLLVREERWEDRHGQQHEYLMIQLIQCPKHQIHAVITEFRRLGYQRGFNQVSWFAPLTPGLEQVLTKSAFKRAWDDSLYLFVKQR